MKYVKLEHRLYIPFGTVAIEFVNYDTNDNEFKKKAEIELDNNRNEPDEKINHLKNQAHAEELKREKIKKERNELYKNTSFFNRIFSKEYKNKANELRTLYYKHNEEHAKLLNKVYNLEHDFENEASTDYYSLRDLLKKSGYTLNNTSPMAETSITIEIWHKK